jgi:hypothetical protein
MENLLIMQMEKGLNLLGKETMNAIPPVVVVGLE